MSDLIQGTVFRVYEKQFPGKPMTFSVKLEDNPIYYRLGSARHAGVVEPGNRVEFHATMNGDGKSARVDGEVKAAKAPTPAAAGSAGGFVGRDSSIQYQSSRKDALEFIGLLVTTDAIRLPAKQADKLGVLEALLDRYTARFYEDINVLGAVQRELEGGEAPESGASEDGDDGE